MSGVNFDDVKPCFTRPARRFTKSLDDRANAVCLERFRDRVSFPKTGGTRRDDLSPATLRLGDHAVTFPWPVRTRLAARMRELYSCLRPLLVDEAHDPGQRLDVIITPDAK